LKGVVFMKDYRSIFNQSVMGLMGTISIVTNFTVVDYSFLYAL